MNQDPQELAERKKLQMEILMKDSDVKKIERTRIDIETTLRDFRHKANLLQSEIISRESQLKKIDSERVLLQNELIKLKHRMSLLSHN